MLRQDNADLRLTPEGYRVGLISEERYQRFLQKQHQIDKEEARLRTTRGIDEEGHSHGMLSELLKHPEHTYESLSPWDRERPVLPEEVWKQAENFGRAGRISGVSPADINVLLVYLARLPTEKGKDE